VDKAPIAAYQDQQFAQEAKERVSSTFIAHIRYASTGGLRPGEHPPVPAAWPAVHAQRCHCRFAALGGRAG
jgi:predicted glutamine amidotransferase